MFNLPYHLATVILLISTVVVPSCCLSSGAPSDACVDLMPNHGVSPQPEDTLPYELVMDDFVDPSGVYQYVAGVSYTITLRGKPDTNNNNALEQFRGFLIQARVVGSSPEEAVGTFTTTADYSYHNCNTTQIPSTSGVTHVSAANKTSIVFRWTALPVGIGTIQFAYTVVQTMPVFWANLRTVKIIEKPCEQSEYLNNTFCSVHCPFGTFGNHTTATCQSLPAGFGVMGNATAYYTSFQTNIPLMTNILNYTVYLDLTTIGSPLGIFLSFVRNPLTEAIIGFDNGLRLKDYFILPDSYTVTGNIATFQETIFVRNSVPDSVFQFSSEVVLDFDINTVVLGSATTSSIQTCSIAFATINQPSDPCDSNQCSNRATCVSDLDTLTSTCICLSAYSGEHCETLVNPCGLDPCLNNQVCENVGTTNYTCNCTIDFTGSSCDIEIDQCLLNSGACNNGTCIDGVGSFFCECMAGFTGEVCDIEINECETTGCDNGQCTDLINGFMCDCYLGWTGIQCEINIDYCSFDLSVFGPCDDQGASACIDGNSTYTCECVVGWTNFNCSTDINECESNPCKNNGTCINELFGSFVCICSQGFSGFVCEVDEDVCAATTCLNGGTCIESRGLDFLCICLPGYSGFTCEIDIPNCTPDSCMNKGTCIEGQGDTFMCVCEAGFTGMVCQTDIDFCETDTCLNGGECEEGVGTVTSCSCANGFAGYRCEVNLFTECTRPTTTSTPPDSCDNHQCLNGAICVPDLVISNYTCICTSSYSGEYCETLVNPCGLDPCLNNHVCENVGTTNYSCNCTIDFTGSNCDIEIDQCLLNSRACNNGTCIDGVGRFSCECMAGFTGEVCDIEINECESTGCDNGQCTDLINGFMCDCYLGWTGNRCEINIDYCGFDLSLFGPCDDQGANACIDGNSTYTCECAVGWTNFNCSTDINECESNSCMNNGTCINELFGNFVCICIQGFSGFVCEVDEDVCAATTCLNGGTCIESRGLDFLCICLPGYSGFTCEIDIPNCTPDSCMNNGTCIEGQGDTFMCVCDVGFTGMVCQTDMDFCETDTCLNRGECEEGVGAVTSCSCTNGFVGCRCEVNLPICTESPAITTYPTSSGRVIGAEGVIGLTAGVTFVVSIIMGLLLGMLLMYCLMRTKSRHSYKIKGQQDAIANPVYDEVSLPKEEIELKTKSSYSPTGQ